MKSKIVQIRYYIVLLVLAVVITNCSDPINDPQFGNSSESQKFMAIAEKSSSVNSFTPNYNEEEAMTLAGYMAKDLYPIRVGQKMKLIDKSLTLEKDSTTAIGTFVQNFEGTLIIEGSFQPPTIGINSHADTTIQKTFFTTITRLIQFKKVADTGNDTLDWKVDAISLPNGGTTGSDIQIVKLILSTQDGTEVVIEDPNAYFFKVGNKDDDDHESDADDDEEDNDNHDSKFEFGLEKHGWKNLQTWYRKNQTVKLSVEILSTSPEPDFLTVTYGAMMNGNNKTNKTKEKFDFVSSVPEGIYFRKIYERKWYTKSNAVRMHAVINALPRSAVYDTETIVEEKTWGIPYRVR